MTCPRADLNLSTEHRPTPSKADKAVHDGDPKKILTTGFARPLGIMASQPSPPPLGVQLGSGLSLEGRRALIDSLLHEINENDLHDVGLCDSLHDEFETWIKEDFLGLGGNITL
ncbi:MAG: hypothetical protein SEPTF4163_006659 [Sporothrix epigloea]